MVARCSHEVKTGFEQIEQESTVNFTIIRLHQSLRGLYITSVQQACLQVKNLLCDSQVEEKLAPSDRGDSHRLLPSNLIVSVQTESGFTMKY